jgi:surfactin synthase thioesterase subunit/uncharacterized protein (DUF697 family)
LLHQEFLNKKAEKIIKDHMVASMGVGVIPVPIVDLTALSAIQLKMLCALCKLYNIPYEKEFAKVAISSLIGAGVSVPLSVGLSSFIKMVPILGHTAGAVSTSIIGTSVTYALGHVFNKHFLDGGTLDNFEYKSMKKYFNQKLKDGRKLYFKLRKDDKKLKLFTIPFAGGNKYSYRDLSLYLHNHFDIKNLELAGRGDRIRENLNSSIEEVVDELFNQIKNDLDDEYIIFGHSLGALIGYLLCVKIEESKLKSPKLFIASGAKAPSIKSTTNMSNLSLDEFKDKLRKFNYTSDVILDDTASFEFFEPILRSDFRLSEKFKRDNLKAIPTKTIVLSGTEDSFSDESILKWKKFSKDKVEFYRFKGKHFFIFDNKEDITDLIIKKSY